MNFRGPTGRHEIVSDENVSSCIDSLLIPH